MTVAWLPAGRQQTAAAGAQLVLLAALSAGPGLGPVGWLAGVTYTVGLWALLTAAVRRARATTLGPAGVVTLARAALVGGVTSVVADGLSGGDRHAAALLGVLAAVALVLDAVDGWIARRTATACALGARFDMEVDAFLILVLSVHVGTLVGPWAVAIGAMRYVFMAVSWTIPWMRSTVPARFSAKVVAAAQGIVLTVVSFEVLPHRLTVALVAAALAVLVGSFAGDVAWLWRNARRRGRGTGPNREGPGGKYPGAAPVTTALAGLLVLVALLAPNQVDELTAGALVRIPVEGLVGVVLLLVLPGRARRVLAVVIGVALGLLCILKIVDMGFFLALARPFHPVTDASLFGPAVGFLTVWLGPLGTLAAVVASVMLVVVVLVLMTFSVIRVSRLVVEHRSTATRTVAVLAPIWLVCALLGVHIVPGVPLAAGNTATFVYDAARQVRADLHDRATFAGTVGVDTFRDSPDGELLTALRGKDVVLAFVESYGRSAIEDPEMGPRIGTVLDDGTRRLNAAGFASRSAFLTSPTAGGGSWLAHATLLAGLWIDNQQRYSDLTSSHRLTLTGAFRRAGWRTVGVMPGITSAWPESSFYGYDQVFDSAHLGYRGPRFSFATMPDQYTLSTFQRLERAAPHHAPLMAVIPLLSSHAPWFPLPRPVAWGEVGDGSLFNSMAAPGDRPEAILTRDPARVRADYEQSIEYSLSTLVDYLQIYDDDNLVLIFLGDHQPSPIVTGPDASRDVPITIVTRDRTVLDRIAPWGWQDGLRPTPTAPTWPMDTFRDRFLTAFGSRIQPGRPRAAPSGW